MLQREISSILQAVGNKYQDLRVASAREVAEAREAAMDVYRKDARYLALVGALRGVGVIDPEGQAWRITTGGLVASSGSSSLAAEIKKAAAAVPDTTIVNWPISPIFGELNIALATCTKKWTALQPDVYLLVWALGSVKNEEELAVAVRAFTKAMA
jgi:hypothetical protein